MNRTFWVGAAGNAVVIEADAFKESDVIYRALSSKGHADMVHTAELVRVTFSASTTFTDSFFSKLTDFNRIGLVA